LAIGIGRRQFISALGGAAAWPLAAGAQQSAMPVIGFLSSAGRNDRPKLVDAFRQGLSEAGYVESRNVAIEFRFAENKYERLPALAADLVSRNVSVIAATGGGNSILAAKSATTTIPIVFTTGDDPVKAGYVASLNRPGGNVTGISFFAAVLGSKGLGLLHELIPNVSVIGMLLNTANPESGSMQTDAQGAARILGLRLIVLGASTPSEIETAFAAMRQRRVGALLVGGDPYFTSRLQQIVALAERDAIPAMYFNREFVADGGLMSYGTDIADGYRRAALYVGRMLKGEKPSELPVDQATRFELVINLKSAKALGIDVPPGFSARADEVIE
jgi:putative ABC transport system substrate-binding protein